MAPFPDLVSYKLWARIADSVDDDAIDEAIGAVHAAIAQRCPSLFGGATPVDDVPDDVALAALLWVNRLLARRNSPEGIVGSELGAVNIGRWDPDVARLMAPYTDVVLA